MDELSTDDDGPAPPPEAPAQHPNDGAPPSKLAPGLHVVATPIGNLGDLTPRARAVLAAADHVLCEDTRVTGRLLHLSGLKRPLMPYHEHNAAEVRPRVLARLLAGEALALVSDAGTPCISDPGYRLVREAAAVGIAVRAVPGPSAVLAALSIAGLPTDRFLFQGFLPPKTKARTDTLRELAGIRTTLVFYESGNRLAAMLADAAHILGSREAAVARELTKLHEEVRRGSLSDLATAYAAEAAPKGEIVVVVGPPDAAATLVPDEAAIDAALRAALLTAPPRRAAAEVANATGLSANALYRRVLALKDG